MHDRRAQLRVPLVARIWVRHRKGTDETRETFDISEGGLRMERVTAPLDAIICLILPLPRASGRPRGCMLVGRVVWKRLNGTGVQFVDPAPGDVEAIRDYIRSAA